MARRHRPPESAHVMRWMVSYADFVTLLFAFFVVLYTISSVNNKKFDELSTALSGVFDRKDMSFQPIQLDAIFPIAIPQIPHESAQDTEDSQQEYLADAQQALAKFRQQLESFVQPDEYSLMAAENWIHLEIPADLIFVPKTDVLTEKGAVYLNELAKVFGTFANAINVEAFSAPDNVQELSDENLWQLSALQAASVTYHLILEGVDPSRLAAVGYGPYHPIATAEDEEGQALNRRLAFMIDRTPQQRERIKTVTKRHLSAKP